MIARSETSPRAELLAIPMTPSSRLEVNSGVSRLSGKIWATLWRSGSARKRTVVVFAHPSSNFMGHYALEYMSTLGVDAVGMTTRYLGNDSALIMENCLLDIGSTVGYLKSIGYHNIVLVGNSGGGGLVALYQAQATNPTIQTTPAGDPIDIAAHGLPKATSIVMAMAHPGRSVVYTESMDPAINNENDPFDRNPDIDIFNISRQPPYTAEFIREYRAGQVDRNRRISQWCRDQLDELAKRRTEDSTAPDDLPFVVHGTAADLRFLDRSIDPSDRNIGTIWGPPSVANFIPASLGHHTSLRSWLSQWSLDDSRANAYRQLPLVTCPVMVAHGTADNAAFPSHAKKMFEAIPDGLGTFVEFEGADHYFTGRPDLLQAMATAIVDWIVE
ncbi:hypothetical protein [Nocardioides sp. AE5]|uniref:hypothetical protein n=1 Tax=Nocardioides sp. AE5 TaxID=2962573 RepID=UPI00288165EB|nr:hypothetical protein [Nocardioides sp. AE5]MDT0201840.1 hypothetical protein [Nocardioides sp. AE5]